MNKLTRHIKKKYNLTSEEEAEINACFALKTFNKKAFLLQNGITSQYEFFVINGCVRTFITDLNGVEHNIMFSIENWWCGDLQSFINRTDSSYAIQALENTEVLAINRTDWEELSNKSEVFSNYTRELFQSAVIAQQNRLVQNLSFTAIERYHYFITKFPSLSQRVSQKHIASFLGITPEFLSFIKNK
ncbi:MAG: cyclic nucleotide-binding domain-containing protein [Crocinitomix sp.]|nr:cyclic nucleotide-binding domain-containing protein [Crocinitomix sp.]